MKGTKRRRNEIAEGGEVRKVTLPNVITVCKRCETTESAEWWKCCYRHVTELGPDVICESCAFELHPGYQEEQRGDQ